MIDPETWVLRNVGKGILDFEDIVISLEDVILDDFTNSCKGIFNSDALERVQIKKFREGEEKWIATLKLTDALNKRDFYRDLHKSFDLVLKGCEEAFKKVDKEYIKPIIDLFNEVTKKQGKIIHCFYPFKLALESCNQDDVLSLSEKYRLIKHCYNKAPNLFEMALKLHQSHNNSKERKEIVNEIIVNSASLLISRILMLRFLEDHNFFDIGKKKYLSNGGIRAFNEMKQYFNNYYPELLSQASKQELKFYKFVVGDNLSNWILECSCEQLSSCIEQVLYYLSYYDFTTVQEDVLSGIYQKILSQDLQKKYGQVYTPPDVARYMFQKALEIAPEGKVMDPACGTGTFLVEYIEQKIGLPKRRGMITYPNACKEIQDLKGNDINPVAASISQMQVMWQLLDFAKFIEKEGFPDLFITHADALKVNETFNMEEWAYSDLDPDKYALIIGNPPYVRNERQTVKFSELESNFYEEISHNSNYYNHFIYKAFSNWLKEDGILAFVLPLSFFDNNDSKKLRRLFNLDGNYQINEIVDMEEISEYIFPQVRVNPIILIARKRTPKKEDKILLTLAHQSSLSDDDIDFSKMEQRVMSYRDLFTNDGRILTRLTSERKKLLDKINSYNTWTDIAQIRWEGYKGNKIHKAQLEEPADKSTYTWKSKIMIGEGLAFRHRKIKSTAGMSVYKGENIISCQLLEPPCENNIDVEKIASPSFWRFPGALPKVAFAFLGICLNLTACEFNPKETAFTNTAMLFFPKQGLENMPFDFLIVSSVYQWHFASYQREGAKTNYYVGVYPRTIKRLPWIERLRVKVKTINFLKNRYMEACRQLNQVTLEQISMINPQESLEERGRRLSEITIRWPEEKIHNDQGENWYRYQGNY